MERRTAATVIAIFAVGFSIGAGLGILFDVGNHSETAVPHLLETPFHSWSWMGHFPFCALA
jgi:hypothetical protein